MPNTVNNFLSYVESDSYDGTVFHRLIHDFVLQGGGFTFNTDELSSTTTQAPILNEPVFSNVQWSVAMAKTSDPDSATNQWFINLVDNSYSLDVNTNSGGFSVFGEVINGFEVIEEISLLSTCSDIPITNITAKSCSDWTLLGEDDFVVILEISIVDPSPVTAENLTPPLNTLVLEDNASSSGGAFQYFAVILLSLLLCYRQLVRNRSRA